MNVSQYVTSARRSCIILLAVGYFALTTSFERIQSSGYIAQARTTAARLFLAELPSGGDVDGVGSVSIQAQDRNDGDTSVAVVVQSLSGRSAWSVSLHRDSTLSREEAIAALRATALNAGLEAPSAEDAVLMYRGIEEALANRPMTIPGAGVDVAMSIAAWAIFVVTLALFVEMTSRLRVILATGGDTREDPWLILDSGSPVEHIAAGIWLISVALTPTLSGVALFIELKGQRLAGAAAGSMAGDLILFGVALGGLIVGTWLAGRFVHQVVHIRWAQARADRRKRRVKVNRLVGGRTSPAATDRERARSPSL